MVEKVFTIDTNGNKIGRFDIDKIMEYGDGTYGKEFLLGLINGVLFNTPNYDKLEITVDSAVEAYNDILDNNQFRIMLRADYDDEFGNIDMFFFAVRTELFSNESLERLKTHLNNLEDTSLYFVNGFLCGVSDYSTYAFSKYASQIEDVINSKNHNMMYYKFMRLKW